MKASAFSPLMVLSVGETDTFLHELIQIMLMDSFKQGKHLYALRPKVNPKPP